jgi:RNA polymerase sigma-70 factor (ECF subfamily)
MPLRLINERSVRIKVRTLSGLFNSDSPKNRLVALRPRLLRLALAWCGDRATAEDLVQACLEKALANLDRVQKTDSLDSWTFTILTNCYRDLCRRSKPEDEWSDRMDDSSPSTERQVEAEQTSRQVRSAIGKLNPSHREVLLLVDLEEFSYADVAEILEIPVGTVMSRLSRARQNLKVLLKRHMDLEASGRPKLERIK